MLGTLIIAGLLFASTGMSLLLYKKWTERGETQAMYAAYAQAAAISQQKALSNQASAVFQPAPPPKLAILEAPHIRQMPELPAGCEITSLAMLLQYYGVSVSKMELVQQMKLDPTPITRNEQGRIVYWGHPNNGFVGDVTRKKDGFGIYHAALYETLAAHVPEAADFTGKPFSELEAQLAKGIPSVVWTTIHFHEPELWVTWETPQGKLRTTFNEHAVLLVGYDETDVYVNDPRANEPAKKINKEQFIKSWLAMGSQALTYTAEQKDEV